MRTLNRAAAEAMTEAQVAAATDVTGFGFLGHLREVAAASGVDAEVDFDAVPILDGARELAGAGVAPGGSVANLEHVAEHVAWDSKLSRVDRLLLCDAQTSGGLLIAVPGERASELMDSLEQRGVSAARRVGQVASVPVAASVASAPF